MVRKEINSDASIDFDSSSSMDEFAMDGLSAPHEEVKERSTFFISNKKKSDETTAK